MRHVTRGGRYLRVADPNWQDPLSGEYAQAKGGRWNAPGCFDVIYLNASRNVARAQVRHKLEPRGIRPEDLDPSQGPVLVQAEVPEDRYVDATTDRGLDSLGLPRSYPLDASGQVVAHAASRPIGQRAWDAGEPGIACRSAARAASGGGEELAYFNRTPLRVGQAEQFGDWYWSD